MKFNIILIICIILLTNVYAYVPIEEYNPEATASYRYKDYVGVTEECKQTLSGVLNSTSFPFERELTFLFMRPHSPYGGRWYPDGHIILFGNCEEYIIIHELAHECQWQKGDMYLDLQNHGGHFGECLDYLTQPTHANHIQNQ